MNTTTSTSRPVSSIHGSSNTSSIELPPLPGLSRHNVLPEEWTLPHEWKMEKRELFETYSLQHYPHPEVGRQFDYSDKVVQAQMEKKKKLQSSEEGGNTLLYGLAKVRHAQQS